MKKNQKPIPSHLSNFLDWLEIEKGLSSKSQENYARFLKKFLDWLKINHLENLKPHEISSEHIWKYRVFLSRQYISKTKKNLKKSTQNYYLIAVRSLLNYFADRDIISLPAEKIKLARDKDARQVHFLNLEQIEKLFSAPNISKIQGLRDRAILETLFSTGMRIAELVALDKDQIKMNPQTSVSGDTFSAFARKSKRASSLGLPSPHLKIKSETEEIELGIIGKGERPRTVYFSARALSWLKKYLEDRNDAEKALFINYRSKKNTPRRLTPRSIEKSIKKYSIIAGLPLTTTPHVMRHSFSTDLLSHGVDLRILQEFLGHKSIAATQIYAHVTSKQLREIHRKFHGGKDLKNQ